MPPGLKVFSKSFTGLDEICVDEVGCRQSLRAVKSGTSYWSTLSGLKVSLKFTGKEIFSAEGVFISTSLISYSGSILTSLLKT